MWHCLGSNFGERKNTDFILSYKSIPTGLNSEGLSAVVIQMFQGSSETHSYYADSYQDLLLRILVPHEAR